MLPRRQPCDGGVLPGAVPRELGSDVGKARRNAEAPNGNARRDSSKGGLESLKTLQDLVLSVSTHSVAVISLPSAMRLEEPVLPERF